MQALIFSLNKKRVFTSFDFLTSTQYITLQSCSSGLALGKTGLSGYSSGQNDILKSSEESTRTQPIA